MPNLNLISCQVFTVRSHLSSQTNDGLGIDNETDSSLCLELPRFTIASNLALSRDLFEHLTSLLEKH